MPPLPTQLEKSDGYVYTQPSSTEQLREEKELNISGLQRHDGSLTSTDNNSLFTVDMIPSPFIAPTSDLANLIELLGLTQLTIAPPPFALFTILAPNCILIRCNNI
ncbi:hypothetical protein C8J56DRAFT_1029944 [Mycena floridula]|nr:hypothetical protein C8J56DRAFT_1029944 [Mycena floridula]